MDAKAYKACKAEEKERIVKCVDTKFTRVDETQGHGRHPKNQGTKDMRFSNSAEHFWRTCCILLNLSEW